MSTTDRPDPSPDPRLSRRREGLAAALAAFMEERNILWGELVGGLLVVGCSVALVISLWSRFSANPLFKLCAFTGAVSALFGAGLYTLRRWRLESTSRGLLLTAALLAPVNVLALALPSPDASPTLALATQVTTLAALALLVWRAGRVFTPDSPVLLSAGVVGISACQPLLAHLVHPGLPGPSFLALGLLPVACNVSLAGALLFRASRRGPPGGGSALGLLLFLGTAGFSLAVTLGLGVALAGDLASALGWLALPISLAGLAPLAVGAHIHHHLADRKSAGARTAGTAVALAGMVVLLLAVGLAWPRPLPVLAACVVAFLALSAVAFRHALPVAHALALPCLTAACLATTFIVGRHSSAAEADLPALLLGHVLAPPTAPLLLALAVLWALAGEGLIRRGLAGHGLAYAFGAGGLFLLGVGLVTPHGPAEPGRAALVYALAGAGTLALNARWRRAEATYLSLALLVGATLWVLWRWHGAVTPDWGPVLAFLGLAFATAGWVAGRTVGGGEPDSDWLAGPLGRVSNVVATGAAAATGWLIWVAWSAPARTGAEGAPVWALAHVATGALLSALCTVRALAGAGLVQARPGSWLLLGAVCFAAGWATVRWQMDRPEVVRAGTLALGGLTLGGLSLAARGRARPLAVAWSETALGAGLLALALVGRAHDHPAQSLTLASVAALALVLAWKWRLSAFAWCGSALVLAALAHALVWGPVAQPPAHPLLIAALAHATLVLVAALGLDHLARRAGVGGDRGSSKTAKPQAEGGEGFRSGLGGLVPQKAPPHPRSPGVLEVFVGPFQGSGLASTLLAVPLLAVGLAGPLGPPAGLTLWLAGLWLALAWEGRLPALFAAFQAALTVAVVLGVAALLQGRGADLASHESLRLHGVALGVLGVLWALARRGVPQAGRLRELLTGSWPGVDRVVLALLVPAQFTFCVLAVVPGAVEELTPSGRLVAPPEWFAGWAGQAGGWSGWALVGLLALALAVEARGRLGRGVLVGLLAQALTVPLLVAGTFEQQRAVASGLRWGLAVCLVVCSLPLWLREQIDVRAAALGLSWDTELDLAALARRLLVLGTVVPVLLLTVTAALAGVMGLPVRGPGPDSVFAAMGRLYSSVVPLGLVCVALVVHALREQLPGYAFAVGLGGNLLATLVLRSHHEGEPFVEWWVPLAQANALAFAGTALLWLLARRRLYGPAGAGALLTAQVMLGLAANVALLLAGVAPLWVKPGLAGPALPTLGAPLGWLALAVAGAAGAWYARALWRDFLPHLGAGLALAAVVLLAHAVGAAGAPWLAYRALTAGWAALGVALLATAWRAGAGGDRGNSKIAKPQAEEGQPVRLRLGDLPPRGPLDPRSLRVWLDTWVPALAVLALGLGLRGVGVDPLEPWGPAGAVLAAAALAAGLALARRSPGWGFAAALGVNLAASLVLEHPHRGAPLGDWWVPLLQVNVIASALAACVWLAIRRRLEARGEVSGWAALLGVQVALPLVGNAALLAGPLGLLLLITQPGVPSGTVLEVGGAGGWLALLTAVAAWAWYLGRALSQGGVHVAGALGLALAVLAACTSARWAEADPWLPQRVLTAGAAALATALLALGWAASRPRGAGAEATSDTRTPAFGALSVQAWVACLGAAALGLAVREVGPGGGGPWSWAPPVLWVGLLSAGLALWRRREGWAFAAGLCLQLAVTLVQWHARDYAPVSGWWVALLQSAVVASSLVALAWLAALRRLAGPGRPGPLAAPLLAVQVALGLVGNLALLAHPAVLLVSQPGALPAEVAQAGGPLGWLALLAALAPAAWYAGRALRRGAAGVVTLLGLALGVLSACSLARWAGAAEPWLAYHALVAGCAATGAATLLGWWRRLRGAWEGLPAVACVALAGALAVGLGLRGLGVDPTEPWGPAGAALAAAALAAGLATARRSQGWAFAAALGLNLCASLVLEHAHRGVPLSDWWVPLVQLNTILGAAVALPWLMLRRRLEARGEVSGWAALLGVQVALPLVGNAALLAGPLGLLLAEPGAPPPAVAQAGGPAGWLALALSALACAWYARALLAGAAPHLAGALGLAVGVLLACGLARWDGGGPWPAYHGLTACWAALALALLASSWLACGAREGAPVEADPSGASPSALEGWAGAAGALVLGLALRGVASDPSGPWWSAGAVLAVAALAAGLALRLRREAWALASTLGVNLALGLVLAALVPLDQLRDRWPDVVRAHVLACAGCMALWQASCKRLYGTLRPGPRRAPLLHLAIGLTLVGVTAALVLPATHLFVQPGALHPLVGQAGELLGWLATLAAGAVAAWHVRARKPSAFGVAAVGLGASLLLACTAARWDRGDWLSCHTLMAGCAIIGFGVLAVSRTALRLAGAAHLGVRSGTAPAVWPANAALGALAAVVTALALRAMAGDPQGAWWPVGVVVAVGLQAGVAAVWLRSESWAIVSTMAADLAVSLVVWHASRTGGDEALWIQLLQANILSGSLASLLWVAINYRVYVDRPPGARATPLLSVQAFLGLAGNAVLLGQPAFLGIIWTPGALPPGVTAADGLSGWLTLGLTAAVALVQLRITRMQGAAQVLGSLGLGAGVLLACTAAHWDRGDWLAYHTLTLSWGVLALVMLLAGRVRGVDGRDEEGGARPGALLSDRLVREWVVVAGVPVLALALRGALEDPAGPWWSAGAVLGVGLLLALVGVWQRRPGWVFVGGLGANLAASLALWRLHLSVPPAAWWRELLQANVAAFGLVALLWLSVTRAGPSPLLGLQLLLGLVGNLALLARPATLLVVAPDPPDPVIARAGNALGWLALILPGSALLWAPRSRPRAGVHALAALALAVVVLASCSVTRLHPTDWVPYHTLVTGAALVGLALLCSGWVRARQLPAGEEDSLLPAGAVQLWSVGLGVLVLALACRAGLIDPSGPWWSAGAILSAGLLAALLGAWRRREDGAFAAGLCLELAASLVLWRAHLGEPLTGWWVRLVQVNLAAGSGAALAWLAAGSRFYEAVGCQKRSAPLRGIQALVGLAGNVVLLVPSAVLLVLEPADPSPAVAQAGGLVGWLTLALALLPAGWHFGPGLVRRGVPLLCAVGLGAGVLLACTLASGDQASWPAYHVLTASWGLTGLGAVIGAWVGTRRAGRQERPTLSPAMAQAWVLGVAALVLGLAGRAVFQDPTGTWWPAGAVLAVGATLAGLAGWRRQEAWAFAAGLGANVAVSLVLVSYHPAEPLESWGLLLAQANLLAGAVVGLLWFAGARGLEFRPPGLISLRTLQAVLLLGGNVGLLAHAVAWLGASPGGPGPGVAATGSAWGWLALLGAVAVAAWQLGDILPRVSALGAAGLAVGALAACSAAAWDGGTWLTWHVLTAAVGLTGAALLAHGWRAGVWGSPLIEGPHQGAPPHPRSPAVTWVAALAVLAAGLGLRGALEDPGRPWWPAGATLWAGALGAGLALWRRREGWAFTAGLALNLSTALVVAHGHEGQPLEAWWLPLLQASVAACSVAALAWLAAGRRLAPAGGGPLLTIQVSLGLLGNLALLTGPAACLVAWPGELHRLVRQAGGAWGWLTLLAALAPALWHLGRTRGATAVHLVGGLGLGLGVLAACSVATRAGDSWAAYHVLVGAWAVVGAAALLGGWALARRADAFPVGAAQGWVVGGAVLLLGLAARAVAADPAGAGPSAAGVLGASALAAGLALWQRREGWALTAALGVNLAASALLWDAHRADLLEAWWRPLLQANVAATAITALLWTAVARRPRIKDFTDLHRLYLLDLQVSLGLAGAAGVLMPAAVVLVAQPGAPAPFVAEAVRPWGWAALLLALAAGGWRWLLAGRPGRAAVAGVLALALPVAGACAAAAVGGWLAYHVLACGWAAAGLGLAAWGWGGAARDAHPLAEGSRARALEAWSALLGALTLGLALRGVRADPAGPWWGVGGFVCAGAIGATLALWRRREVWAFAAGLCLQLAVALAQWHAHGYAPPSGWWVPLLQSAVVAASGVALAWLAALRRLAGSGRPRPLLALQVALGLAGNLALLAHPAILLVGDPGAQPAEVIQAGGPLGWLALGAALAPACWYAGRAPRRGAAVVGTLLGLALSVLSACALAGWEGAAQPWLAYHALVAGCAATGVAALLACWRSLRTWEGLPGLACVALAGALVLGLGLRGLGSDPAEPWGPAGAALAAAALAAGLALGRRSQAWAFCAALGLNLAASLVLEHAHRGAPLGDWWVPLLQVNVIASALAAYVWLALSRRFAEPEGSVPMRTAQVALGLLGNAALLLSPAVRLVADPTVAHPELSQAGTSLGWLALLAALGAAAWHAGRTLAAGGIHVLCCLGLALGVLVAASASHADPGSGWLAYHVLLAAWAVLGAVTLTVGWAFAARPAREGEARGPVVRAWVTGLGVLVVALAVRGLPADPAGPWWSAGGLAAAALLAGALAVWGRTQRFVHASGVLLTAAGLAAAPGWGLTRPADLVWAGLLGLAGSAAAWTLLEGALRRYSVTLDRHGGALPFGQVVGVLAPVGLLTLAGTALAFALGVSALPVGSILTWPALAASVALLVVCLGDPSARFPLAGLYGAGLAALGLAFAELPLGRWWLAGPALAAFVTLAALLRAAGAWLPLPPREGGWPAAWFLPAQGLLGGLVTGLSLALCLAEPTLTARAGGPTSLALLLAGLLLLAKERGAAGARHAALLLVALGCAESGWVWLDPAGPAPWLERTALLLAALSLLTLAYGVGLARLTSPESGWPSAGRRCGAILGVASAGLLVAVLAQEAILTIQGVRPLLVRGAVLAVALALVVLMAAGIAFALRPDLDPLGLPERGRTGYVYGAELLLLALFAHLRLSAPELFSGRLQNYWPFLIFAVAFASAGLGEALTRLKLRVLAEPLSRTGVLLPVVPVLAFWVRPAGDYATLWFVAGAFYGLVAVVRRNLGFALLAALAGNVGLWVVLQENQVAFIRYPQLWLVPFSLTVLVASHLNRDRLGRAQITALRYASLTVIYLASAAETFLSGLGHGVTRPLVLVGLALLGVVVGMLLRVRAFLFLGAGFVGMGVLALVWHAAESRSWLWYVAGIVLGAALVVLFAVFEKRRNDVLRLVERLREWE